MPEPRPAARIALPCLLFVGFLGLYAATMSTTVLSGDSAEFQVLLATGGIAHPTGYPLQVFILRAWSVLPFGDPAFAANMFSVVCGAATLVLLYASMSALTGSVVAGVVSALSLGLAPTFWENAIKAEVYTLFTTLCALAVLIAVFLERARSRLLVAALGVVVGLALTQHAMLLLVLVPCACLYPWMRQQLGLPVKAALGAGAVAILVALTLYCVQFLLYDHPDSPGNYLSHFRESLPTADLAGRLGWLVSARQYQSSFRMDSLLRTAGNLSRFVIYFGFQFSLAGLALGCLGAIVLLGRNRLLGLLCVLICLINGLFGAVYVTAQQDLWSLPSYLVFTAWIGLGAALVLGSVSRRLGSRSRQIPIPALVLAAVVAASSLGAYYARGLTTSKTTFPYFGFTPYSAEATVFPNLSGYDTWEHFGTEVFALTGGARAAVFTRWNELNTLKYYRHVLAVGPNTSLHYRPKSTLPDMFEEIRHVQDEGGEVYFTFPPPPEIGSAFGVSVEPLVLPHGKRLFRLVTQQSS